MDVSCKVSLKTAAAIKKLIKSSFIFKLHQEVEQYLSKEKLLLWRRRSRSSRWGADMTDASDHTDLLQPHFYVHGFLHLWKISFQSIKGRFSASRSQSWVFGVGYLTHAPASCNERLAHRHSSYTSLLADRHVGKPPKQVNYLTSLNRFDLFIYLWTLTLTHTEDAVMSIQKCGLSHYTTI